MKKNIVFAYDENIFDSCLEALDNILYVLNWHGIDAKKYPSKLVYPIIKTNVANITIMNKKAFSMEVEMISQFDNAIWHDIEALLDYLTELIKRSTESLYPNVMVCDKVRAYCENDVESTRNLVKELDQKGLFGSTINHPEISKVIFNEPATIVFWSDGSKTVVKIQDGDKYDPEKGLAMAISKKFLGNRGNYYDEFKKWLPEEEEINVLPSIGESANSLNAAAKAFCDSIANSLNVVGIEIGEKEKKNAK